MDEGDQMTMSNPEEGIKSQESILETSEQQLKTEDSTAIPVLQLVQQLLR